jgi:transcriptional regulator GlxA family with amidase domain
VRQQTGLSPKALGRVLRFQRALHLLIAPAAPAPAHVAAICGYYDQAHLHRDFRALAGTSPGQAQAAYLPAPSHQR